MTTHLLRLYTDTFDAGVAATPLPALNRVLYVVRGSVIVRAAGPAAPRDANAASVCAHDDSAAHLPRQERDPLGAARGCREAEVAEVSNLCG